MPCRLDASNFSQSDKWSTDGIVDTSPISMTIIGAIDSVISRLADAADNALIPYKSIAVGLLVAQTAFELYIM